MYEGLGGIVGGNAAAAGAADTGASSSASSSIGGMVSLSTVTRSVLGSGGVEPNGIPWFLTLIM